LIVPCVFLLYGCVCQLRIKENNDDDDDDDEKVKPQISQFLNVRHPDAYRANCKKTRERLLFLVLQ